MLTIVRCLIVNIYPTLIMEMDIKEKVGNNIKTIRISKNLSQEKLSHLSETDRTYIQSIEKGKRNVSIVILKKIADALNVEICKLLEGI